MTTMQATTYLKNALDKGEKCIGFWLTYNAPPLAKTILQTGDYKWVLIDAEHGQITDADFYVLSNLVASAGVSPIIRLPYDSEWMIKRALDAGVHGILTPMCHTAEDARRIVRASKYPPVGARGYGPMFSAHTFGIKDALYAPQADDNLLVLVQIESREGVANVEDIAAVEGVDVLFIGGAVRDRRPFDLSKQMNVTHGGEEHEAAMARTLKAAKAGGKKAAIFCSTGAQASMRLKQGFDMVSTGTDAASIIADFSRQYAAAVGQDSEGVTGAY